MDSHFGAWTNVNSALKPLEDQGLISEQTLVFHNNLESLQRTPLIQQTRWKLFKIFVKQIEKVCYPTVARKLPYISLINALIMRIAFSYTPFTSFFESLTFMLFDVFHTSFYTDLRLVQRCFQSSILFPPAGWKDSRRDVYISVIITSHMPDVIWRSYLYTRTGWIQLGEVRTILSNKHRSCFSPGVKS